MPARRRGGEGRLGSYLLDEVRLGDEAGGAPERVVDVGAERLQLRGEAAVDHRAPSRLRHELLHHAHRPPQTHTGRGAADDGDRTAAATRRDQLMRSG